jgi:hypothetical protein
LPPGLTRISKSWKKRHAKLSHGAVGIIAPWKEELRAIDEAVAELDRGEAATEAQVRAAYAKFRGS